MEHSILNYLEKRYLELEKEIARASLDGSDLSITDLKDRKAVIADEIEHDRQLVRVKEKLSD